MQKNVFKIRITDLDALKQRLRTEWAKLDHVHCGSQVVSGVVDSSRSVMCVLYTISRNIPTQCNKMDSNLANFEAIVEVGKTVELLFLATQW